MFSVLACRRVEGQGAHRTESYHGVYRTSVAVLTGNTCVYNDSVMSERKHMHFLVWRGKKENEVGLCGSNKHTFPPKQTSLGTDWCRFGPQYWESLKGMPQAFFPSYNIYVTYVFLFHAGLLGRHTMHSSFGLMEH